MVMETWIFGYGSIIWRPGFEVEESRAGYVDGWMRRFWQGSPDHRGTPERPGRVMTLIPAVGERCWGRVFRLSSAQCERVLRDLDRREQGGYRRVSIVVNTSDGVEIEAICYVANPDNPHFLGPAPMKTIVDVIATARGPSGTNHEYAVRLAEALREIGHVDSHMCRIERELQRKYTSSN